MSAERDKYDIVIVGAGHAGAQAAVSLRKFGFEGSVLMIGDEAEPPYERPPLSKEYLMGEKAFERMLFRPIAFWEERSVELALGNKVNAVDADRRTVALQDGSQIGFDNLIWAAGGTPRKLPICSDGAANVFTIRNKRDVDCIHDFVENSTPRVAVIGGGYIGLEAAAAFRKSGSGVTIIEAAHRVLSRVAGDEISAYFHDLHVTKGALVKLDARIVSVTDDNQKISQIQCADGDCIDCDIVIVGIGIEPSIAPLAQAGAKVGNGVQVDKFCRTSLDGIYAIGDCAEHLNPFSSLGTPVRLESVQNANDMATVAAKRICGGTEAYCAVPWFWSHQFDARLQTVGLSQGYDETVIRGSVEDGRFSVIYLSSGKVIALDCVNSPKDYMVGRKLVGAGVVADASRLQDSTIPLMDFARNTA